MITIFPVHFIFTGGSNPLQITRTLRSVQKFICFRKNNYGFQYNRHWRPGDHIEVDPEIYLKTHKYPKDELMMNPYLRFPIYHRLPLLYRLMIEEEVVSYS